MLKAVHFSKGKATRITQGTKTQGGFTWLDLQAPTKEDLREFAKDHKLFLGDLEDALDDHERARVHLSENYPVVIYKVPFIKEGSVHIGSVGIFWVGNTVITVHKKELKELSKIMENNVKSIDTPIKFIHFLLEIFTTTYFRAIEGVGDELEALEERAIRVTTTTHTRDIFKLKKRLIYFQKSLIANREVLLSVKDGRAFVVTKSQSLSFGDIYNDNLQLIDIVGIYSEVLGNVMETDMASSSTALGDVMKKLTVVASFALIPTLIASIYGMNFRVENSPWNMPELLWFYGYPFALGLMALSIIAMYYYFKKHKWL